MHYYQHHIGDFIKATARLSDSQTMAYLRLLWMYYDREKPLKPDTKLLAFQIGASVEDTELLLESFFVLCENGWHQTRCDQEIADYHAHIAKKSNAGKASAERRKNNSSTGVQQVFNSSSTAEQLTTNHKPITKDISMSESVPTIPFDQLIDLYEKHLPELPSVRKSLFSTGTNAKSTKQRWDWVMSSTHEKGPRAGQRLAETQEQALEWFDKFFGFVSQSDFLTGRDKKWSGCNLGWLMNRANFEKVLSGQYHKKD